MHAYISFLNEMVNQNHQEYQKFSQLNWLNSFSSLEFEEKKDKIVNQFSKEVNSSFKETKSWINRLSKGCQLCGEGEWSCLFITGKCNANCFYCPTTQDQDDKPTSQQIEFDDPLAYADFINHFDFKGCSFSGGEPLLFFDRTLKYLQTIRKHCSPDLYIWMYTNGILANTDNFRKLADAGLNETRFDIGAVNYKLKAIEKAAGIIPTITVEIPAIPEELNSLKNIIPQLIDAGVSNLNLHQLRLTPYNVLKLQNHPYHYTHGEHPTVVESELTALEIIQYVDSHKLDIGVNYCGFQYKNRFQKAGYRTKIARKIITTDQGLTENGFIREIYVPKISSKGLTVDKTIQPSISDDYLLISKEKFMQNKQQYPFAFIEYTGAILNNLSEIATNKEFIQIKNNEYPYEKGKACNPIFIEKNQFEAAIDIMNEKISIPPDSLDLFTIWNFETIENGNRNYF